MDRDTGTNMKPITLASALGSRFRQHNMYASSWPLIFCAVLMYFQLGRVHVDVYGTFVYGIIIIIVS